MSGCECKPDAKRKRGSAQPEAKGAAIKKKRQAETERASRHMRDTRSEPFWDFYHGGSGQCFSENFCSFGADL
jgi:hypothetical protein